MWKAISEVLTSENGIAVAVLLVLLIVVVIFGVRSGLLNIKTDKIQIGRDASDIERTIVRNQIEWCKLAIPGLDGKMPHPKGFNPYRAKYIFERVFDEEVTWVIFNHIEDKPTYIQLKQEYIWNLIQTLVEKDEYRSDEFKEMVYSHVESVIRNLVRIRKEYQ